LLHGVARPRQVSFVFCFVFPAPAVVPVVSSSGSPSSCFDPSPTSPTVLLQTDHLASPSPNTVLWRRARGRRSPPLTQRQTHPEIIDTRRSRSRNNSSCTAPFRLFVSLWRCCFPRLFLKSLPVPRPIFILAWQTKYMYAENCCFDGRSDVKSPAARFRDVAFVPQPCLPHLLLRLFAKAVRLRLPCRNPSFIKSTASRQSVSITRSPPVPQEI